MTFDQKKAPLMNDKTKPTLEAAIAAGQSLPDAMQEALAAEILERVAELGASSLSPAQRDEIKRRLAAPAEYAYPTRVADFFRRHGVS